MDYVLLLVDGEGRARSSLLRIRTLREFPGLTGLSVHFRPVRNDRLFESAKTAGELAYRVLFGEGIVRSQLWIEYQLAADLASVTGRSSDLLFALALTTAAWKPVTRTSAAIAATGVLDSEGAVHAVNHLTEKLSCALRALTAPTPSLIFYPAEQDDEVHSWRVTASVPPHITLYPVAHLDDALTILGYQLDKVYLGNPFRGLEHFDYAHHAVFFGRDREIQEAVERLLNRERAGTPGLLIEGASGSGKSSFLRAGVLPALVRGRARDHEAQQSLESRPFSPQAPLSIWRPGLLTAPVDERQLVDSVLACWLALPELRGSTPATPFGTFDVLADWRKASWPVSLRFVWIVDQLEEILHLNPAPDLLESFGRFLLRLQADGAWTLASARADAMPELKRIESLRQTFGANDGQYYLPTLTGLALDEVIALPAQAASLEFGVRADGRRLDEQLREDAYRETTPLPLLQFTLNELYQRRVGRDLTFAAYEAIGGLAGSIATAAAAAFGPEATQDTQLLWRLFRSLVTVDEHGHASRRFAPLAERAPDLPRRRLIGRLVDARLCVTDQRNGAPVITLAHDTLLHTLPALTDWLREEAELLQTRDQAERDARLWHEQGQADAWLATADKLVRYRTLETQEVALDATVQEFLLRSTRRDLRTTRLKRAAIGAIAALAILASIAGVVATRKQHEAELQTAETRRMQQKLAIQVAADRLKQGELSLARGIVLDVLAQHDTRQAVDPLAANVFQEVRSQDSLLAVLPVHERESRYLRYSPDGRSVVVVPLGGPIQVWDADLGVKRFALSGEPDNGGPAEFSPDGHLILSGGSEIYLWNAETGRVIRHQKMPGGKPASAQFLPGGRRILLSYEAEDIVDARTFRVLRHIAIPGQELYCTRVSPAGTHALCHLNDNDVGVLDLNTGRIRCRMHGHTDTVIAIRFSLDGRTVVTGGADTTVKIWDATTGRLLQTLKNRVGQVWGVALSPDGREVLAAATDHSIRIWDWKSATLVTSLKGHSGIAVETEFSPSGTRLATLAYDGTVRIWKWGQESAALAVPGDVQPTGDPSFSPDGALMVAPSSDKGARIWRVRDGNAVRALKASGGTISWAGFTKDGAGILTASEDNKLQWWNSASGALLREMGAGGDEITAVGLSPDGQRAAVGHANAWTLHDLVTGAVIRTVSGLKEYVTTVMFSPDGRHLLTTCLDHTVAIWDVASGTQQLLMLQPDHTYGGGYSHDGTRLLAGSEDHIVRIWDAHSGKLLLSLIGHPTRAYTGSFSPDDRWIATAGQDRTARVWDARSGEQLAIYRGFPERVGTVNWSPDGQMLVPTTFARTVHFVSRGELAPLAEQIAWAESANPDPLTREDRQNLGLETGNSSQQSPVALSSCEAQAGAPYDPMRRVAGHERIDINPELAIAACSPGKQVGALPEGEQDYLQGRALWAAGRSREAQSKFDAAWRAGYAAAGVDAALLRLDQERTDAARAGARSQLNQAWDKGVARAETELARLDGGNAEGEAWLRKAEAAGDPGAFALEGEWEDQQLLTIHDEFAQRPHLLASLNAYRQAVQIGDAAGWPEQTVRDWRFRRATLARMLAQRQQMHDAVRALAIARR
jgi:WD40 repeat protein